MNEICKLANKKGWRWNPYGPGFTCFQDGRVHAVGSEREVFEFVGLPYREPEHRGDVK